MLQKIIHFSKMYMNTVDRSSFFWLMSTCVALKIKTCYQRLCRMCIEMSSILTFISAQEDEDGAKKIEFSSVGVEVSKYTYYLY